MTRWISVKERFPENFQDVLFYAIRDKKVGEYFVGHRENDKWFHCWIISSSELNTHDDIIKITHWMALPDAPDE